MGRTFKGVMRNVWALLAVPVTGDRTGLLGRGQGCRVPYSAQVLSTENDAVPVPAVSCGETLRAWGLASAVLVANISYFHHPAWA